VPAPASDKKEIKIKPIDGINNQNLILFNRGKAISGEFK
jgi:hypothetical protein